MNESWVIDAGEEDVYQIEHWKRNKGFDVIPWSPRHMFVVIHQPFPRIVSGCSGQRMQLFLDLASHHVPLFPSDIRAAP